jgi:hypothetical protein
MKKAIKGLLVWGFAAAAVSLLAPAARADAGSDATRRGSIDVTGKTIKAVTVGPALVRGYSAFAGGTIFVARLATGTDADCAGGERGSAASLALAPDRVESIVVGAGEIACLETETERPFELLWHAFPSRAIAGFANVNVARL